MGMKTLLITASAAAALAACGGGETSTTTSDASSASTPVETSQPARGVDPRMAALKQSEEFLDTVRARDGVLSTDTGLLYEVVSQGPADGSNPAPGQFVCVHYHGELPDGSVFDSSVDRGVPAAFPSDRLISGWVEALGQMKPGDSWKLYLHPDLAYGQRGSGGAIGPNQALVFDVELIKLLDGPVPRGQDCRNF